MQNTPVDRSARPLYNPQTMRGQPNSEGAGSIERVGQCLLRMCNSVESLFADALVAYLDGSPEMADELRTDDYRVHEQWVEIDRLCRGLLSRPAADRGRVRSLLCAVQIAGALKRAADESQQLGQRLRECGLAGTPPTDSLPRMIELTQTMLGDVVEALVNRDPAEASGVHLVFRELADLHRRAEGAIARGIAEGGIDAPAGAALMGVPQRLLRIGDEAVGIAGRVARFYREAESG
ncbi:MAG: phosphate signaling complex PhoU family protein [Planctomycetota bacterium]